MGCVIKYKGQSIPEEQFLQYLNKQIAINNLFNENTKFASQIYEASGFVPKMINREGQEYFNNPRIRFFVKIADEVRASLPGVKEGYTRLYRGNRPSDLKSNPQFTNSLEGIALPFLMSYEGQLSYIDVPTSDLSKYVQKRGVASNAEFIVTSEIAKNATPIDNTIVEKYKEQYPDKLAPVEITPQQKATAQQLYSQYLNTIFPDSKVKDIVYHGADEKIDNFTLDKKKNKKEKGLFFFKKRKSAQLWRDASFEEDNTKQGDLISALINLNTPETIDFENKSAWDMAKYSNENVKGDGLIATNVDEFYAGRDTQYVIFEPEQIHILGSKQDIENFKKFVEQPINKEIKPNEVNLTPQDLINHSGGAYGGDTFWDLIGREFGVTNHKHYKDAGNANLSQQLRNKGVKAEILTKEQMDFARQKVKELLGVEYKDDLRGNLQVRNFYQVYNADAVYAIAKINNDNKSVSGGTNTAIQLGIKLNKPVYVWDINTESWYKYEANVKTKKIEGINIFSKSSEKLGKRLTNPNWYAKDLMDVEAPYKANASKIKAPQLNAEEALKYDMNLMYNLQVQKFRKNPELIDEINEAGGLEFIRQSSHLVGVKNSRWEGKGMESNFIKVLAKSYETVAKELNKFKENIDFSTTGQFEITETPKLTKNFAGIGSRDIENYNVQKDGKWQPREEYVGKEKEEKAKQAIRDVYQNTLNRPTEIKPKIDSSKKIESLKRGDIINFQQQEFLVERIKNEGIDVRDVNTGDVDFISTEDYINETQEQQIVEETKGELPGLDNLPDPQCK